MTKGFVLVLTILFLLLLTLFSLVILSMAGSHYSSSGSVADNENARIACDVGIRTLIDRHNLTAENPRFLFNPSNWSGTALRPIEIQDHLFSGHANQTWNSFGSNLMTFEAKRGRNLSRRSVTLRQRRLEDFALYSSSAQTIPSASVVKGLVRTNNELRLVKPGVLFLDRVQADVQPPEFATFKRLNRQSLQYPSVAELISNDALRDLAAADGLIISSDTSPFWSSGRYVINLDLLQLIKDPDGWLISYNGVPVGSARSLLLWFEGPLEIAQSWSSIPFLASAKLTVPLYLMSSQDVLIASPLQSVEQPTTFHPLCVFASRAIQITASAPKVCRIEAFLIARGSIATAEGPSSVVIANGGAANPESATGALLEELHESSLVMDHPRLLELKSAIEGGQKTLWFRGGLALTAPIFWPADLQQVHFQTTEHQFPIFPSLPFVYVGEGSREWL